MKSGLKWSLTAGAVLVVSGAIGALSVVGSLGGFDSVADNTAASCTRISGMPGAEDIEPDYATGFAYVSSDDRWAYASGDDRPGAIYRINMNEYGDAEPIIMSGTQGLDRFHPHGVSFYQDDGRKLLFVISHRVPEIPAEGHDIYVFEIQGTHLALVETLSDPGFRSPNDLVAVGARQFYFTNDRQNLEEDGALGEVLFGLAVSDIAYFDGEVSRVVADGLAFANGIQKSPAGDLIYATAYRGGTTLVYRRDKTEETLALLAVIETGSGPDNITIDEGGDVWVMAHVNTLATVAHAGDPNALAPARVYRIEPGATTAETVYENDGSTISAASVSVPYQNWLFMGAIYQDGVVACEM